MCGLVGVFGKVSITEENVFEDLLSIDVIRGPHSTGVATVSRTSPEAHIFKGTVLPQDLFEYTDYKNMLRKLNRLCMGHNRFATVGKVSIENAHPFSVGHITLTHNGTIRNKYKLPDYDKFDTDSEAITNAIATIGIEETWKLLDGAACLIWWDSKEETLNIIRNTERPMHFTYNADKSVLVWASEDWMIRGTCARRKVKMGKNKIFIPKEHVLFTFKYDDKAHSVTHTARKLEAYTPPIGYGTQKYGGYYNGYGGGYGMGGGWPDYEDYGEAAREREGVSRTIARKASDNKIEKDEDEDNVVPFYRQANENVCPFDPEDLRIKTISEEDFHKRFHVCCLCNAELKDQYKESVIVSPFEAVCDNCATMAELNNLALV